MDGRLDGRRASGWELSALDNLLAQTQKRLAASADVVVVTAGFDSESEAESADRTFRLPLGQDELIRKMTTANKNTIVVMTSGGSVDMKSWLDRVPALVQAWYSGQEGGTALAEILFGDVNPSGRLPVTFERRWEDNPVHDSYYPEAGTKRVVYKEGVLLVIAATSTTALSHFSHLGLDSPTRPSRTATCQLSPLRAQRRMPTLQDRVTRFRSR